MHGSRSGGIGARHGLVLLVLLCVTAAAGVVGVGPAGASKHKLGGENVVGETAVVQVAGVKPAGSSCHGLGSVEAGAMVEEDGMEQAGSSKCKVGAWVGGMAVVEATKAAKMGWRHLTVAGTRRGALGSSQW